MGIATPKANVVLLTGAVVSANASNPPVEDADPKVEAVVVWSTTLSAAPSPSVISFLCDSIVNFLFKKCGPSKNPPPLLSRVYKLVLIPCSPLGRTDFFSADRRWT